MYISKKEVGMNKSEAGRLGWIKSRERKTYPEYDEIVEIIDDREDAIAEAITLLELFIGDEYIRDTEVDKIIIRPEVERVIKRLK